MDESGREPAKSAPPSPPHPLIPSPRLIVAVTVPKQCTQHLRGQLRFAQGSGFDVALLCSPGELAELVAREEGVPLLRVPMEREIAPLRDWRSFKRICGLLRRCRPHIVNAGTPKAGLLVTLAAWLCRVPVRIYTLRGMRFDTASGPKKPLLKFIEKLCCAAATDVICISPSLREHAVNLGVVPREKTIVLGAGSSNGLDVDKYTRTSAIEAQAQAVRRQFGIAEGAVVIGYVGRLVRDKGMIEMVAAWREIKDEFPQLHLLMVGPFEAGDPVPPDVEHALKNDARIHLAGHVPGGAEAYYAAMDILALPSYREGFGNVLLEAAAMEIPSVATRIPGIVDAVADGVSGTLVPPRDASALAAALRAYVGDADLRRRHGQQGRERALRDFREETIWQLQVETYRELLARAGAKKD